MGKALSYISSRINKYKKGRAAEKRLYDKTYYSERKLARKEEAEKRRTRIIANAKEDARTGRFARIIKQTKEGFGQVKDASGNISKRVGKFSRTAKRISFGIEKSMGFGFGTKRNSKKKKSNNKDLFDLEF